MELSADELSHSAVMKQVILVCRKSKGIRKEGSAKHKPRKSEIVMPSFRFLLSRKSTKT
jgi:hypothetical protein